MYLTFGKSDNSNQILLLQSIKKLIQLNKTYLLRFEEEQEQIHWQQNLQTWWSPHVAVLLSQSFWLVPHNLQGSVNNNVHVSHHINTSYSYQKKTLYTVPINTSAQRQTSTFKDIEHDRFLILSQ